MCGYKRSRLKSTFLKLISLFIVEFNCNFSNFCPTAALLDESADIYCPLAKE